MVKAEHERPGSHRFAGLDVMRALAISLVLLAHLPHFAHVAQNTSPLWRGAGIWGVELFFVLSGFLITGILYRVFEDFSFARLRIYFIRRWMRTIPLYYVAIVITIVLEGYFLRFPIEDVGRYLLFIQTIPTGNNRWFGVSWSLSIEEWSYVLYPCLAAGLWSIRDLNRRLALIFAAAIIVLTAHRLSLGSAGVPFDTDIRRALVPRLDALAYGGMMRVLWIRYREALYSARHRLLAVSCFGQIVCLQVFMTYGVRHSFAAAMLLTLLPICLCLCFPFAMGFERIAQPMRRLFWYGASRSYALYLFHVPVFILVGQQIPAAPFALRFMAAFGVAFMMADAAYRLIEKPFMDMRPAEPEDRRSLTVPLTT